MTTPGPDIAGRTNSTRPPASLDASVALRYVGFVPDPGPEPAIRPELREPLPAPLALYELDDEDEDSGEPPDLTPRDATRR